MTRFRVLMTLWLLSSLGGAQAAEARFTLAAQDDWNARTGFYLNLENTFADGAPGPPDAMILALGVADGAQWGFATFHPAWQYDRTYHARVVVAAQHAELWLDGARVGTIPLGAAPCATPLVTNEIPSWTPARTAYFVNETSLTLRGPGSLVLHAVPNPDGVTSRALTRALLNAQLARPALDWTFTKGDSFTIDTSFTLAHFPAIQTLAPLVDRYGQFRQGDWPEKVHADNDLGQAAAEELLHNQAWGPAPGCDRFGGDTRSSWREAPTGFFRVVCKNGVWWLISPEGHPCFYRGVDDAPALAWEKSPVTGRELLFEWLPPHTDAYSMAWGRGVWGDSQATEYVGLHTCNLMRKYGAQWQQAATSVTATRLDAWGFTGAGKWDEVPGKVVTPVLFPSALNVTARPDIFDPAVQAALEASLRPLIEPRLNDPFVLGWTVRSEVAEIITANDVLTLLALGANAPVKRALVDFALTSQYSGDLPRMATAWGAANATTATRYAQPAQPPAADVEALRRFYADRYYAFLYETVRKIDPHHLYLGFWIAPYAIWVNEEDWRLIARYCDVVSYDRYALNYHDPAFDRLIQETGMPVFCGEFSFPPTYGGQRGLGSYGICTSDDGAAGDAYARWLEDAAKDPFCVGVSWFEYRDEPLAGRGPSTGSGADPSYGEHYAFGLVDVADRPKWNLVGRVRAANLRASDWRLGMTLHDGVRGFSRYR